ncbi:MAG: phage major capsid protein [candidate division NC10 bacterium]
MAGLDFAGASNTLKEDYQPAIRENVNQQIMLVNQVSQNTEAFAGGEEAVIAIHVTRNNGTGARKDGATLPTAGKQGHIKLRIPVKLNYGVLKVTGKTIEAMKSDKGSFARAIELESNGLVKDLKRDYNRQLYTPSNGTIATVASGTSTTVFVVDDKAEARRLEPGALVDIYNSSFVVQDTGAEVLSTVISTKTITLVAALAGTPSANDIIVRAGVVPVAVTSAATEFLTDEIHGLTDIVDDGVLYPWLHGIDGTASTIWKSYQKAVSAVPSDTVFEEAMEEVDLQSNDMIDLWITSMAARRTYAAGLKSQKRFPGTLKLKGGFKATTISSGGEEVALFAERDCPDATAFGVTLDALQEFILSDWHFMDLNGTVLDKVAGEDAYVAIMRKYSEFGTDRRNAHAKLTGLVTV